MLFADVDSLKGVNYRFGHRAGDTVLSRWLELQASRVATTLTRLAGDEFVCRSDLRRNAGAAVSSRGSSGRGRARRPPRRAPVPVSISVGVADLTPSLSADDLPRAADAAMYVSKRDRTP